MAGETKCEACDADAYAVITYFRTDPAGRVRHPVCRNHGKLIWDAMSTPLRDTAIIEDVAALNTEQRTRT